MRLLVSQDSDEVAYFTNLLKESITSLEKMVKVPAVERNSQEFEKQIKMSIFMLKLFIELASNMEWDTVNLLEVACRSCELPTNHDSFDLIRRHGQILFTVISKSFFVYDMRE